MRSFDIVPSALALPMAAVADVAIAPSGPSQSEWSGLVMAALALVVRELLWWLRNRKSSGSLPDLPPSAGDPSQGG